MPNDEDRFENLNEAANHYLTKIGRLSDSSPCSCSELIELLAWAVCQLDSEALVCTCCADKRRRISEILQDENGPDFDVSDFIKNNPPNEPH